MNIWLAVSYICTAQVDVLEKFEMLVEQCSKLIRAGFFKTLFLINFE